MGHTGRRWWTFTIAVIVVFPEDTLTQCQASVLMLVRISLGDLRSHTPDEKIVEPSDGTVR